MKRTFQFLFFLIFIFTLLTCGKESPGLPIATTLDVIQSRMLVDSEFEFRVELDKECSSDVTIEYATSDGTAHALADYQASAGTIIIPKGSKSGKFKIVVRGDSLRTEDKIFFVQLTHPKNCSLAFNRAQGTIVNSNGMYLPVDNTGYSTPTIYNSYSLVWNDEFNGKTIDNNSWIFESGNNNGWGNHELENYTNRPQNAFVSNGNLIIEARAENYNGSYYTSSRMITKGKKSFKFGRIDIRAKLPKGKGIWPALWMLGSGIDQVGWPLCGEIDIMELVGNTPEKVFGTLHWGTPAHTSSGNNYTLATGIFNDQFHVFSLIWNASEMSMYVDDNLYFSKNISTGGYPFSEDFFFIFNVAVGGDWPGAPDETTQFPQRMIVDYVRVFQ